MTTPQGPCRAVSTRKKTLAPSATIGYDCSGMADGIKPEALDALRDSGCGCRVDTEFEAKEN